LTSHKVWFCFIGFASAVTSHDETCVEVAVGTGSVALKTGNDYNNETVTCPRPLTRPLRKLRRGSLEGSCSVLYRELVGGRSLNV